MFFTVKVDSSCCEMPSSANSAHCVERAPVEFAVDVEAFRLFTGPQTSFALLCHDFQAGLGTGTHPIGYNEAAQEVREALWRRFRRPCGP